ncbi:hypothetical protein TBR22_A42040 [Luteitalea sp. TBR-22]|nr:hypothetical protein TBR22_A42040 [Luteitalea sp. TBR-22]
MRAGGAPATVGLKVRVVVPSGSWRLIGTALATAMTSDPSAFLMRTMCRFAFRSMSSNTYSPAGSVAPGTITGPEKRSRVRSFQLSARLVPVQVDTNSTVSAAIRAHHGLHLIVGVFMFHLRPDAGARSGPRPAVDTSRGVATRARRAVTTFRDCHAP